MECRRERHSQSKQLQKRKVDVENKILLDTIGTDVEIILYAGFAELNKAVTRDNMRGGIKR